MAKTNLTANNLKTALWETLQKVKSGKMDAGKADSIATQGREIIRTINTQIKISQHSQTPLPKDVMDFSK